MMQYRRMSQIMITYVPFLTNQTNPSLKRMIKKKIGSETFERDFQAPTFTKYPWASFNEQHKHIECFPCTKFGKTGETKFTYTNWKKTDRLKTHGNSKTHIENMLKWMFSKNETKKPSVLSLLDSNHEKEVKENRDYLKIIIETLLFLTKQNIAIRGHEESRSDIGSESDINRGNFLELLSLRCKDIPWLEAKIKETQGRHASWLSPTIQNEIIDICGQMVKTELVNRILLSNTFGIIVDETTDISNDEQVSLCLRYIHEGITFESFVAFLSTKTTDGETLFNLIRDTLNGMGLNPENIVGQCFDGASNMCGKNKGVATRIQEIAPRATYVHCFGHRLNLALQDTLQANLSLRNTLGVIQALYNFFNSPKRQAILKDVSGENVEKYITLKSFSETRWSCRWESVRSVMNQLGRIIIALNQISKMDDTKMTIDANGLIVSICDIKFIYGLHVLKIIFSNTNALSEFLQGESMDVITASTTSAATIRTLEKCREDFELTWSNSIEFAKKISVVSKIDIDLTIEARSKRVKIPSKRLQALVGETPDTDVQQPRLLDDMRTNVYFDALDRVILELKERFQSESANIVNSVARILVKGSHEEEDFVSVSAFYGIDCDDLNADCRLYSSYSEQLEKKPLKPTDIVSVLEKNQMNQIIPRFAHLASIFAIIPATSCSAERSFSCLRRLKTYLRNAIGQERLSNCALLNIERQLANQIDIQKVIDNFGKRNGRQKYFF